MIAPVQLRTHAFRDHKGPRSIPSMYISPLQVLKVIGAFVEDAGPTHAAQLVENSDDPSLSMVVAIKLN